MLVRLLLLLAVIGTAWGRRAIRVSCIGDSITQGACGSEGYPAKLQKLLGDDFLVGNYGNSGRTMLSHGLCNDGTDCAYINTPTWPAAQESHPDIVTIMMGTNDAKTFNWFGVQGNQPESYVLDYLNMIKTMRGLSTRPLVYVMTPVPLYEQGVYAMNQTVINDFLAPIPQGLVSQISDVADVRIIDIHSAFNGYNSSITCDGCHPTDEGFEVIAKTMAPFMLKAAETIRQRGGL